MAEELTTLNEQTTVDEQDIAIKITGLKKRYRLGLITAGTLKGDLQSWWARVRGKEDPNLKIGAKVHSKNEVFMALDGIDLTIYKGERVGIIGHNGAGKSTLLKLLSRVTGPTEGEIKLDGRITSMLEVGTGFNGELTGRENVYLNGAILGMTKAEVDKKMDQIIEFSECRQFIDTPVKRYSSGMFVKLAFSVAAHLDSEIMIMDEVLAVGDMAFQKKCLDKMNEVSKDEGRTILYVSHNMNTIRQLCSRVIVLNHGKVIFNGDVEEGINVYAGKDASLEDYIVDLDNCERPYARMGKRLHLNKLTFVSSKNSFSINEKIEFTIEYTTKEVFSTLFARAEIRYRDDTPIGIFESSAIEDVKQGENSITMSFNPCQLPKGQYYFEIDFYERGANNLYLTLDHPIKKVIFTILDDTEDGILWDHKRMGHVRLGELSK